MREFPALYEIIEDHNRMADVTEGLLGSHEVDLLRYHEVCGGHMRS